MLALARNAKKPKKDYAVVGRLLSYEPFGLMFRRNDADFKLIVNKILSQLFRSGEIEKIYDKWFEPLGEPMDEKLKTAFVIQELPAQAAFAGRVSTAGFCARSVGQG